MDSKTCCDAARDSYPYSGSEDDNEQLAVYCKALGHPHRLRILRFLLSQDACFAGEIAEQLPIAASTVSQHLSQLRDAGLIRGEVDGPRRCYCVEPRAIAALKALVGAL
jgi:ArsR family transcriptional regulator